MKRCFVFTLILFSILHSKPETERMEHKKEEFEIPITEDLMREHGVLNRILLIYDEIIKRIKAKKDFPLQTLKEAVMIIRAFVENYHEKMEEEYLFPLFEKYKKEVRLVRTLKRQHDKGKEITAQLLALMDSKQKIGHQEKRAIKKLLTQFVVMYRPHEAREDTVLFPLVRSLMTEKEFDRISEESEKLEEKLFGENGFEKMLSKVCDLEKSLDIYELESFTPLIKDTLKG